MNSKERVHAAMRREPVDRLPVFMWFHPQTAQRLAGLLEIPVSRVSEAMGDDVRMTWVNNNYAMEGIVHEKEGESHVDFWGVEWTRQYGFNQITGFPLARASRQEVLVFSRVHAALSQCQAARCRQGRFVSRPAQDVDGQDRQRRMGRYHCHP